jgi:hypothetical protein
MQVMVDIEKLGPCEGGEFLQISAVSFDFGVSVAEPIEILENKDRFVCATIVAGNGMIGAEEQEFWGRPENAPAYEAIISQPHVHLRDALLQLQSFCNSYLGKRACIWAKPPGYDIRALEFAYRDYGIEIPWHMRQHGCLRTLVMLADRVPREKFRVPSLDGKGLVKHNALHDCVAQVALAQSAWRALHLNVSENAS